MTYLSKLVPTGRAEKAIVIETVDECWVIPKDCELLKLLLKRRDIRAGDFKFESSQQCQCFIKELFLLAVQDAAGATQTSPIACLARDLLRDRVTENFTQGNI